MWRRLLYAVYASLIFISVRIIFRLVEFSNGTTSDNQILNVEWYQYVFDSIPIFFAGLVFVISHPGTYMQGPGFGHAGRDVEEEVRGAETEEEESEEGGG